MRSDGGHGRDVLYRQEALERAARVHDVSYELVLELAEGRETYAGHAVIEFRLDPPAAPLFLDFTGTLRSVRVNGIDLEADHRGHRIWLAPEHLRMVNRIVVDYHNSYDATGDGFHAFRDPEDGATYLYSNLEPYSAHRLFPSFDQPDIKATYRLQVTAPESWQVISAEAAMQTTYLPRRRRMHEFPRSASFSTYLFSLIAGPYVRLEAVHDGVPLGLYGRASMRAELERSADEIFEVTSQGFDYYTDLFGRRYPFGKYDQLFVPEFNAGAMENVGAVTFHDSFLFRDPPTYGQRLIRGEVILHELAHMWFGNLVTMRWWDDLWLNETFATYLSYRCLADATRFRDAWQVFNGQMRPAAYAQDQRSTTHPVATRVEHTNQAVGNFDAITYEKGAAVIKQLVATLGDEAFRRGLQAYIERHAWGNATLADFLGALGEAGARSLDDWARDWLQTSSLNTIAAHWSASDGRIESFELRQSAPPDHPVLRPHSTTVALVSAATDGEGLRVEAVPARIDGARVHVPGAIGRAAPLFVYPNHGDEDYALARLDPVSLGFALERLAELPEALLRQQAWSTLWELVRSAELSSTDYLEAVRRFAPREADRSLLQSIVDRAIVVQRRYVPETQRAASATALVGAAVEALRRAEDGDLRLVWARAAASMAGSCEDVGQLLGLIDGRWSVDGFTPDQDLRWTLAIKAVAHGLDDANARLDHERARDPSDRGQRALIRAGASEPDAGAKQAAWQRINGEGYGSDYLTRAAISGFQWAHQRELLLPFRVSFYERLATVYATRDHAFAESYLRSLVPDRWAEASELERIRSQADGLGEDQGLLRRHLLEVADDLERDIRVQAFASGTVALVS
jgi:aminopeptidase N